jgi:hypothetical protein
MGGFYFVAKRLVDALELCAAPRPRADPELLREPARLEHCVLGLFDVKQHLSHVVQVGAGDFPYFRLIVHG